MGLMNKNKKKEEKNNMVKENETNTWHLGVPTKEIVGELVNEEDNFRILLRDRKTKEIKDKNLSLFFNLMTNNERECYDAWLLALTPATDMVVDSEDCPNNFLVLGDYSISQRIASMKEVNLGGGFMYNDFYDPCGTEWRYSDKPIEVHSPKDADFFNWDFICYPIPSVPEITLIK